MGRGLPVHRGVPGPAVRHHPRDGAHRDHHGRVRDGGDPLRAARPLRGPERRPLGLHLQRHQELPRPRPPVRPAGPRQRDDDGPVHAGVHRAARRHLPPARRAGDRRHERVHPRPPRPGGHRRGRSRRSGPTRSGRPGRGSTAPGWRTPTSCPSPGRCSTRRSATGSTSGTGCARTSTSPPRTCSTSRRPAAASPARSPTAGCAATCRWASGTSRRGCGASAPSRSTTSWRTPPRPRSRGRRCGSGCTRRSSPPRARASTPRASRRCWPTSSAELPRAGRRPVRRRGRPVPAGRAGGGLPDVPHGPGVHAVPGRPRLTRRDAAGPPGPRCPGPASAPGAVQAGRIDRRGSSAPERAPGWRAWPTTNARCW